MIGLSVFPRKNDSFGLHELVINTNNTSNVVLIVGHFLTMVIRFSPNKNNQKSVEEQAVSRDYKPFLIQPTCQYFSY